MFFIPSLMLYVQLKAAQLNKALSLNLSSPQTLSQALVWVGPEVDPS